MFKKILLAVSAVVVFSLSGCGGGSSNTQENSNIEAPTSIKGKAFRHTVHSGTGGFATSGEYVATMSASTNTYVIVGDGVNVSNSIGTYTYSKNGNIGIVEIDDSVLSTGKCTYTFSKADSGSYLCQSLQNAGVKQNGVFTLF
jgi:hypothetical protein